MNELVTECFCLYDTYSKGASDMPMFAKLLCSKLSDLDADKVVQALDLWVSGKGKNLPTPADIREMITPAFIPDFSYYNSLKKRNYDTLNYMETKYVEAYEKNAMRGI